MKNKGMHCLFELVLQVTLDLNFILQMLTNRLTTHKLSSL